MRAIFYRYIYKIKKYFPYVRVGKSTLKIPLSHLSHYQNNKTVDTKGAYNEQHIFILQLHSRL